MSMNLWDEIIPQKQKIDLNQKKGVTAFLQQKKNDIDTILYSVKKKVSSLLYNLETIDISNETYMYARELDIITSFLKEIDNQIEKVSLGKI